MISLILIFGCLCRSYILYFQIQVTEKYSTAMCYLLTHPPHPLCPPLFVTHCLLPSLLSLCPGGSLDPLSWAGLPTMKNLAISELSSEKSLLFPSDCFKMISSCSLASTKIPNNFHNRRICAAGIFWFSITNCQHTHWATKVLHYCGVAKSRHWRARFCAKTRLLDGK